MNAIFGGAFSSRLNLNLREAHAYTYGARSTFDMRQGPGPFSAGGAIVREKTGPAVQEILNELARIRGELVSETELADAKTYLNRRLPARFETAADTAETLAGMSLYGLPLDEMAQRAVRIRAVTREDVKRVAETYLKPDAYRIVIVGDRAVVEGQLADLKLGKIENFGGDAGSAKKPEKKP